MCGRFINLNKKSNLNKIFNIINPTKNIDKFSYNIAPSQNVEIITNLNSIKIEKAKWGYKFIDKKDNTEKNLINSRLETIQKKIIFKDFFEDRKCLIPSNGYYEWRTEDNVKFPFFINIPNKETIFFGGIWKYSDKKNIGTKLFSIITKPANKILSNIHNRMPLMFSINESIEYINNKKDFFSFENFVSEYESSIEYFKVSKFVNNPINDSHKCIEPIK